MNYKFMQKNERPYVVYWNNVPAPYMVDRFNAVARRGKFKFEVWFNDRIQPGLGWRVEESTWRFRFRYLPTRHLCGYTLHWPTLVLGRKPDVLVSLYAEPVFIVGWSIAKLRGSKTCFRVLKTFDRWVDRHPLKEALKRLLFKSVDGVETPGKDGKKFAMNYGIPASRVFFATHAIDVAHFQTESLTARAHRDRLRQRLGLKGTVFIYVGRLWWGKGVDQLVYAFKRLQKSSGGEVSLLFVGGGPEEKALRRMVAQLSIRNVVFAGFQQKCYLPYCYAAADVFVFPTLGDPYGLVVDEAMACSLPVISTSAAGEIYDRIEDGVNGYIVPPQDTEALMDRMLRLSHTPDLCARMGKMAVEKVVGHTPDHWAADFERMVTVLLSDDIRELQ